MGTVIELADHTIRDGIGSLWGQRVHSDMVRPVADVIRGTGYSVVDMPLTATAVVVRVYTDLAVLRRDGDRWLVRQQAPGIRWDQVVEATGFPLEKEGTLS